MALDNQIIVPKYVAVSGRFQETVLTSQEIGAYPDSNPSGFLTAVNTTYSKLTGLKSITGLIPGQYYRISDFHLMWYNQSYNDNTIKSGISTEPLTVLAVSGNKISHEAKSELYPQDTIYYDIDASGSYTWGTINNNASIPNFKGWIYRRTNNKLNIDIGWDWRNITVNCCRPDLGGIDIYDTGVAYPYSYIVKNNQGKLYYSTVDNNQNNSLTNVNFWTQVTVNLIEGETFFPTDEFNLIFNINANVLGYPSVGTMYLIPADTGSRIQQPTFTSIVTGKGDFSLINCKNIKIEGGYSNVIQGLNFYDNVIGNNCNENLIVSNFFNNIIGNNFIDNFTTNNFSQNQIANNFSSNIIGTSFQRNNIANSCSSNIVGSSFINNQVGNNFSSNVIGIAFFYNQIGNNFQTNFVRNSFAINSIGNWVFRNTIGLSFAYNSIENQVFNNNIKDNCSANHIQSYFSYNSIGNHFNNNSIGSNFSSNTGIGNNFQNNIIGNSFNSNYIGNYFSDNTVGNVVQFNNIGDWFWANTIGNNFSFHYIENNFGNNTVGNNVLYGIIGNNFNMNIIENNLNINDLYIATHIYNQYHTRLFKNSNNVMRLSYFNQNDQLVVTDPTE